MGSGDAFADLGATLSNVVALLDAARTSLRMLHPAITETIASDVWPQNVPEPARSLYVTLDGELRQARAQVEDLAEHLCGRPRAKFLRGAPLSDHEYYALRLEGIAWPDRATIFTGTVGALSEFELYRMFQYEDEHLQCLINPGIRPRVPGRTGVRIGRPPEELPRAGLRQEQREFFAKHLPDILARFA